MPVGEKSVVTDALEAVGQNVQQEPAYELVGCERYRLRPCSIAIVSPREGDAVVIDREEPVIGDRNPMCVPSQVSENMLRTGKRSLGVDQPFGAAQRCKDRIERRTIAEVLQITEEAQLVGTKSSLQLLQKQAAVETRQHAHRQKEALSAGDPAIAAR